MSGRGGSYVVYYFLSLSVLFLFLKFFFFLYVKSKEFVGCAVQILVLCCKTTRQCMYCHAAHVNNKNIIVVSQFRIRISSFKFFLIHFYRYKYSFYFTEKGLFGTINLSAKIIYFLKNRSIK